MTLSKLAIKDIEMWPSAGTNFGLMQEAHLTRNQNSSILFMRHNQITYLGLS